MEEKELINGIYKKACEVAAAKEKETASKDTPDGGFDLPELDVKVSKPKDKVVEDGKPTALKMAFIGAGQGGGNLTDIFWRSQYRRALIINTTSQDFKGLECPNRMVLGEDVRGTGKDPDLGARVFAENREDVLTEMRNVFGKEVEQVMVCLGGGGGSGGGAVEGLIDTAKEYLKTHGAKDSRVGVMVSMPSPSEGSVVVGNAEVVLKKLMKRVRNKEIAPLVIADNAKILKIYPGTKIGQRWEVINRSVCGLFDAFNVLAAQSSRHATFDHQDYRKVLDSGVLIFGKSSIPVAQSGTALSDAIRENLKGGFLSDRFDLKDATHAAVILVAPEDALNKIDQEAYDTMFETLERIIGKESVTMYQGIFENPKVEGIHLYTIAGGFEYDIWDNEEQPK